MEKINKNKRREREIENKGAGGRKRGRMKWVPDIESEEFISTSEVCMRRSGQVVDQLC